MSAYTSATEDDHLTRCVHVKTLLINDHAASQAMYRVPQKSITFEIKGLLDLCRTHKSVKRIYLLKL